MKPLMFDDANEVLLPAGVSAGARLPVYTDGKQCISCWRPTLRERVSMLFFGRAWLFVQGGKMQPPVALVGKRGILLARTITLTFRNRT